MASGEHTAARSTKVGFGRVGAEGAQVVAKRLDCGPDARLGVAERRRNSIRAAQLCQLRAAATRQQNFARDGGI